MDAALIVPPVLRIHNMPEHGVTRFDEYFAMPIESDAAADWRDRFFRRIASDGVVPVYLGDMETIRTKCCMYVY